MYTQKLFCCCVGSCEGLMGTQKLFCCCVGNRKGLLCFKSLDCSLVLATGRCYVHMNLT